MIKSTKALASLSLALLAGCVAPKQEIEKPLPVVYGPFRSGVEGIMDMLGDSVIRREVSEEELRECRGSPNPIPNYRLQNLYHVVGRSIGRR